MSLRKRKQKNKTKQQNKTKQNVVSSHYFSLRESIQLTGSAKARQASKGKERKDTTRAPHAAMDTYDAHLILILIISVLALADPHSRIAVVALSSTDLCNLLFITEYPRFDLLGPQNLVCLLERTPSTDWTRRVLRATMVSKRPGCIEGPAVACLPIRPVKITSTFTFTVHLHWRPRMAMPMLMDAPPTPLCLEWVQWTGSLAGLAGASCVGHASIALARFLLG